MKRYILTLLGLAFELTTTANGSFPRPAVVQKPAEWTLAVKYEHPQQITLRLPGRPTAERFWYLILSVTNDSGNADVPFVPACELATDNFEVIPAGIGVPNGVFEAIKRKHQGSYPFLESLDFEDNRVRRGPDNTHDVVIIWKDFNLKAKEVTFFIGGLSNETAAITHPTKTDAEGNPVRIFLQKTLSLRYRVGADPSLRHMAKLEPIVKEWVMR